MDKAAQFEKIYANLPLGQRSEIVVVVDNEPLTWNVAKVEIENNTDKAKQILDILTRLKILQ